MDSGAAADAAAGGGAEARGGAEAGGAGAGVSSASDSSVGRLGAIGTLGDSSYGPWSGDALPDLVAERVCTMRWCAQVMEFEYTVKSGSPGLSETCGAKSEVRGCRDNGGGTERSGARRSVRSNRLSVEDVRPWLQLMCCAYLVRVGLISE